MKKNLFAGLIISAVFIVCAALPAKAFYLQIPHIFKSLSMDTGKTLLAEEGTRNFVNPVPAPQGAEKIEIVPQKPMEKIENKKKEPSEHQSEENKNDSAKTSAERNEMKPIMMNQPNNQDEKSFAPMPSGGGPQGQGMGSQNQGGQDDSKMEAERARNDERQLRDMKRGVKDMERNLVQFERMVTDANKKGIALPADVSEKVAKVRSIIDGMKKASTAEEFNKFDFGDVNDMLQGLEETRREVFEGAQRMQEMRRNMKGMEQGLTQFERNVARLEKQNIAIPQETKDALEKIKTIVAAVKDAKTWDEMQAAGLDDLRDLMDSLQEQQGSLERLSRWPQVSKQMTRELTKLDQALKRDKTIVAQLNKKGIDLASVYTEFENAVTKLKSVRDDVASKMSAGQAEDAFNAIENDFFGQMDDTWQYQRTIETMGNLARFSGDFKRGIADADRIVRDLKRKKFDTAELEQMLADTKEKGQAILDLMKVSPIDEEMILEKIQDLENAKVEFGNKVEDLTGESTDQSWNQQGPGMQMNFQAPQLPSGFDKMMPPKQPQQNTKQ